MMSIQAYDMHADWRQRDGRRVLEQARAKGGTVTAYAKSRGFRSFVVSWPSDGCEGHLYVVRLQTIRKNTGV